MARWEQAARDRGETNETTEDDLIQRRRFRELSRPDDEVTTHVDVRPVIRKKLDALACHASQMRDPSWTQAAPEEMEKAMGEETFVRVEPKPAPGERETALMGLE
jgi:LmbE family N-acetylglucosaminyl deacetylase